MKVANLESSKYPDLVFSADPDQPVDVGKHSWGNYFLAAYKGVFEAQAKKGVKRPDLTGIQVTIHGTVPTGQFVPWLCVCISTHSTAIIHVHIQLIILRAPVAACEKLDVYIFNYVGSGLSSSAAIVCAVSVALLWVYDLTFSKEEISEFTAKAEQYVGVTSGGMDQAISMLGAPGIAKLVEFNPVRAHDVPLPPGASFVICNSLAVSNKAEGATGRYNLRVVECRLAAAVLAVALGETPETARKIRTLREVEPLIERKYGAGPKGSSSGAALAAVDELLHAGTYSTKEIEAILQTPLESLYQSDPAALRVLAAFSEFKLHDRAAHVYVEAARVHEFAAVCRGSASAAEKIAALGALMDDSHASCRDLYQCSCPELDQVVSLAKSYGAVGARLTGAGWGGCTVSLVKDEDIDQFLSKVGLDYC